MLVLLLACTSDENGDSTPPATPTGLSPTAGNGQVVLNWNANTETDLASYKVYRGTTSGNLSVITTVTQPSTSHTDTTVTNGTTYFYAITALDDSNNESPKSSEVSATPQDTSPQTCVVNTSVVGSCVVG